MICGRCKQDLPEDSFSQSTKRGRQRWCKDCSSAYSSARYKRLSNRKLPATKACSLCRETLPQSSFTRHAGSPDGLRAFCRQCAAVFNRSQKYRLTDSEVLAYLAVPVCQNHRCQSRFNADSEVQFDHDPASGRMRGALCMACNTTAGRGCRNTISRLRGLADYLERFHEQG